MKEVNKHPFPLVSDYLINKPIKEIKSGDILLIGDTCKDKTEDYVKRLKLVIIDKKGAIITKGGNILVEGFDCFNIGIRWLPRFTFKFCWESIKFDSFDEDGYIVCCSKGTRTNYLFEPYKGNIIVLNKKEKFANFFNLKM